MILEFAVWRAVPRLGRTERRRSLCDGCYAVELNLQILPVLVFRHQNCVRATLGRLFTGSDVQRLLHRLKDRLGR